MSTKGKKSVVKVSAPGAVAGMSEVKPRLYLDLEGVSTEQLSKLKVNDTVELKITGKVKAISQRERQHYSNPKKSVKTGSLDVEDYTVEVMEDESNEFTKLAESEEAEA